MLLLQTIFIKFNKIVIIKIFLIKGHIEIQVDQSIQKKYLQVDLIFIMLMIVNSLMIKK